MDTITTGIRPITANLDHGQPPTTAEHDHDRTVATFSVTARTITVFIRCTSPGRPLFLNMDVHSAHRAGKLEAGDRGRIEVSGYSGWECFSALTGKRGNCEYPRTMVTRARR
jgi:hypothetical protein